MNSTVLRSSEPLNTQICPPSGCEEYMTPVFSLSCIKRRDTVPTRWPQKILTDSNMCHWLGLICEQQEAGSRPQSESIEFLQDLLRGATHIVTTTAFKHSGKHAYFCTSLLMSCIYISSFQNLLYKSPYLPILYSTNFYTTRGYLFSLYRGYPTKKASEVFGDFRIKGKVILTVKYADNTLIPAKETNGTTN